jgi:3-oxoacyl-[acyl-carrier protein] reductase
VSKNVARKMMLKACGSIVNVSSVSAIKQAPGLLSYATSKAAVDMITKSCAIELAPYNIRVNRYKKRKMTFDF